MVDLPNNIKIVGLTGQSGAGKSTVSAVFAERGFKVVDCDTEARKAADDVRFLGELEARFPERLVVGDRLDRAAVAGLIFNDAEKRGLYQRIIFPYIVNAVIKAIRTADGDVLLDAPTLFESGLDMICDKIVSVIADPERCAERIMLRDGITLERARERLSSQHSAEYFRERSDLTIENNGTPEDLKNRAAKEADTLCRDK